jgi:hypothetical protein
MSHIVLIGDSIFDNSVYVEEGQDVISHLKSDLGRDHCATLLAFDGAVLNDVSSQLRHVSHLELPATHLAVSCGGNDVLALAIALEGPTGNIFAAAQTLADWQADFREQYVRMIDAVQAIGLPVAVCTIYDAVPGLAGAHTACLALFNDIIIREAIARRLTILDLRLLCCDAADYSSVSAIEPSGQGGQKIAHALHDFATSSGNDATHRIFCSP